MRTNVRNTRGFTLAELTVVLAVVTIVSTMVVSFVTILTQRNRAAKEMLNTMQDIEVIETMTEAWIEKQIADGYTIDPTLEEGTLCAVKFEESPRKLFWRDHIFENTDGLKYSTSSTIIGVSFDDDGNTNDFYYVTVTYKLTDKSEEQTYTFCVNPYVGEEF